MFEMMARVFRFLITLSLTVFLSHFASAQEDMDLDSSAGDSRIEIEPPPVVQSDNTSPVVIPITEQDNRISRRRSPWGVAFFNWSSVGIEKVREGRSRLETYNYFSFDYRLNYNSKISIRPEFYIAGAGDNFMDRYEDGSVEMGDIYVQYSHNSWALLPGDIGLLGAFRVYYPNAEHSKQTRQLAQLQARMIFNRPFGNGIELAYHLRPKFFVQTQKTYRNEFFNVKANQMAQIEQLIELSKRLTPDFGISQSVGAEHRWIYGSDAENIDPEVTSALEMTTSASLRLGGISFRGGVTYSARVNDRNSRVRALYNESDSEYFLMTYAYF